MLTETHAHLDYPIFKRTLPMCCGGRKRRGDADSQQSGPRWRAAGGRFALAEADSRIFAVAGVHPTTVEEVAEDVGRSCGRLRGNPRVVAIGEAGLDYHRLPEEAAAVEGYKRRRLGCFRQQLEVAVDWGLNVVIHQRDAWDDTLEILRDYTAVRGVYHCLGTVLNKRGVIPLGHMVSFTGIDIQECAAVMIARRAWRRSISW